MSLDILFLSRWFPYPTDNGIKIRIYHMLRRLASSHRVDLISFVDSPIQEAHIVEMQRYCRQVQVVPYRPFQPLRRQALAGFFSPQPRSVQDTYNLALQHKVDQALDSRKYDLLMPSNVDMAPYVVSARAPLKILEDIELAMFYDQVKVEPQSLKKLRRYLMWRKWAAYMAGLLRHFDGCTVVSEREAQIVRDILPPSARDFPVQIVPNGVDVASYDRRGGSPEPDSLVFSGALTYSANYDAIDFFLSEIYPILEARRPSIRLSVTGRIDGVAIERLALRPGVKLTGYLDDVRPAIQNSWVSIVPLRYGGGTRLKILESLALGTPVVSTSKGVEGLNLRHGQEILIADTPQDFAQAVLTLLSDPHLRADLCSQGRKAVADQYDWGSIGQNFLDWIDRLKRRSG